MNKTMTVGFSSTGPLVKEINQRNFQGRMRSEEQVMKEIAANVVVVACHWKSKKSFLNSIVSNTWGLDEKIYNSLFFSFF